MAFLPYDPTRPLQGGATAIGTTGGGGGSLFGGLVDNALGPFSFAIDLNTAKSSPVTQYWAPMQPVSPLPNISVPSPPALMVPLNPSPGPMKLNDPLSLIAYQNQPAQKDYVSDAGNFSPTALAKGPSPAVPTQAIYRPAVDGPPQKVPDLVYRPAVNGPPVQELTGYQRWKQHQLRQKLGDFEEGVPSAYVPSDEQIAYEYDLKHGTGAYERSRGLPPPGSVQPQPQPARPAPVPHRPNFLTRMGDALNPYGAYQRMYYQQYVPAVAAENAARRQQEMDLKRFEKEADYGRELDKQRLVNQGNMATEQLKQATELAKTIHAGRTLAAKDALDKALSVIESQGATSGAGLMLAKSLAAQGYLAPEDHPEQSPLGLTVGDFLGAGQSPEKQLDIRKKLLDVESQARKNAEESLTQLDRIQKQHYETMQAGAQAAYANQNAAADAQAKQWNTYKAGIEAAVAGSTAPADVQRPFLQNQQTQLGMAGTVQGMDVRQLTAARDTILADQWWMRDPRKVNQMQQIQERLMGYQPGALNPPDPRGKNESREQYAARIAAGGKAPSIQRMVPPPPPVMPGADVTGMYPVNFNQQWPQQPAPQAAPQAAPQQAPPRKPVPVPQPFGSPQPRPGAGPINEFVRNFGQGMENARKSIVTDISKAQRAKQVSETEISPQLDSEIKAGLGATAAGQQSGAVLTDPQIKQRFLKEADGDAYKLKALLKYAGWSDVDWQDNTRQIRSIASAKRSR